MEGLERLERAVAHTLSSVATKPEGAGAIPELAGLDRTSQQELPVEEAQPPSAPAWAAAAGMALTLSLNPCLTSSKKTLSKSPCLAFAHAGSACLVIGRT